MTKEWWQTQDNLTNSQVSFMLMDVRLDCWDITFKLKQIAAVILELISLTSFLESAKSSSLTSIKSQLSLNIEHFKKNYGSLNRHQYVYILDNLWYDKDFIGSYKPILNQSLSIVDYEVLNNTNV